MKSAPKIGTTGEHRFIVAQEHAITFASDGMPAVLSTPNLIALMERTAREAIAPFLEQDERSVGVEVELRHLAPTPLGAQVTVTTRVIGVTGRFVDFQIEAILSILMLDISARRRGQEDVAGEYDGYPCCSVSLDVSKTVHQNFGSGPCRIVEL